MKNKSKKFKEQPFADADSETCTPVKVEHANKWLYVVAYTLECNDVYDYGIWKLPIECPTKAQDEIKALYKHAQSRDWYKRFELSINENNDRAGETSNAEWAEEALGEVGECINDNSLRNEVHGSIVSVFIQQD